MRHNGIKSQISLVKGERNVCQDVIPTPCPRNELQLNYILKNLSLIYKLIMGHEVYSNRHHVGHYI